MEINFEEILKEKIDLEHIKVLLHSELYYKALLETYKEVWNLAVTECAEEVKMTGIAYGSDTSISDYEVDKQSILKLKI